MALAVSTKRCRVPCSCESVIPAGEAPSLCVRPAPSLALPFLTAGISANGFPECREREEINKGNEQLFHRMVEF